MSKSCILRSVQETFLKENLKEVSDMTYQFSTSQGVFYQTSSRSVLRGMMEYYASSIERGIIRVVAVEE